MGQSLQAPPPMVYPQKTPICKLLQGGCYCNNHHAPILAQIRAMQAAAAAYLQCRLTPKGEAGGIHCYGYDQLHEEIKCT